MAKEQRLKTALRISRRLSGRFLDLGVVVPVGPSGLGGLRALTPVDSCAEAHLPTVVLRPPLLRMAHGVGGLNLVSDALRSRVFDLLRRDSKHSKRLSDGCQKKNRLRSRGFHPHPRRSRNAVAFVSICVASWKIVVPLSANALVGPLALLGAGSVCPIPVGALRWASCECVCARDFSG